MLIKMADYINTENFILQRCPHLAITKRILQNWSHSHRKKPKTKGITGGRMYKELKARKLFIRRTFRILLMMWQTIYSTKFCAALSVKEIIKLFQRSLFFIES